MGESKVLLHTCCAPCSSAIIEALMNNGITPVIYYCNPNIYPREEYEIRKDECTRYARALGLEAYGVAAEDIAYLGQTMRDVREILARNKDALWCLLQPEPTFLGEAIPVSGNGDLSNG